MQAEVAGRRYELLHPIAAGGMGEVFLGRARGEHGFEKAVAVKRIKPELARDAQFVVRFVAEAKLAVSLSHANVVQVFDLGRAGDDLLLVMEHVQGADLGQLLGRLRARGERMPAAIAVYVACEALEGLAYAHDRTPGVIHCDVSPSNLLVSFAGEVKLTDFGVAQALGAARAGGRVMGKARYMAPEQSAGQPFDARADLYALGIVLREMLEPELPAPLLDVITRATAEKAAARPASARALLAELTRLARDLDPITAPDVGAWARRLLETPESPARRPRTETQSRPPLTFIARDTVDGVTRLDALPPPRRRLWPFAIAALALAMAPLAWFALNPAPKAPLSETVTIPINPNPKPDPVPTPLAAPAPVPAPRRAPTKPPAAAPQPGYLNLYAEPWAHVSIDGTRAGTTPLARFPVSAGSHRVRFENPHAKPVERVVHVEAGQTQLLDVDLESP
jgi:serine/threonine protein kinase